MLVVRPHAFHLVTPMTKHRQSQVYREMIDALTHVCRDGQGQIGARRAREGVWNTSASADFVPDQHQINLFLARLSPADREVLAGMLAHEVEVGVFETLKVLEQFEVAPFETGYEGGPFDDFIGRLAGWDWPEE